MASIEHFENESRPEVTLSAVKRHVPSTPRLGYSMHYSYVHFLFPVLFKKMNLARMGPP